MSAQTVSGIGGSQDEYGIVIYDVPAAHKKLYYQLRTRISKLAIRLNLSVYLIPWGERDLLTTIIEEATQKTGQRATVFVEKFDNSGAANIKTVAAQCLSRDVDQISKRLREQVEEVRKSGAVVSSLYLKQVEERLKTAEALAVVFGLTADVRMAMEAAKETLEAEKAARKLLVDETVIEMKKGQGKTKPEEGITEKDWDDLEGALKKSREADRIAETAEVKVGEEEVEEDEVEEEKKFSPFAHKVTLSDLVENVRGAV